MRGITYRVGLAALCALLIFAVDEIIGRLLSPNVPLIVVHSISIIVVAICAFVLQRYALTPHREALLEATRRQPDKREDVNRLLLPLLGTMQEGMLIVNSRLDIILYNDAATSILNLPPPDSLENSESDTDEHLDSGLVVNVGADAAKETGSGTAGRQMPRLVDGTRDPAINVTFQKVLAERQPVEMRVELIGRKVRVYQLRVTPLGENLAAGVFFDITELEHLERVRREFFANLSHELRTPLTAILAYAETLESGGFNDAQNGKRFVEKLHKHATLMSKLINTITDLSTIESGKFQLSLEPIRLRSVVADMIALTETRRQDRRVSFCVSIPDDLFVNADRTRLQQILSNLIDNAVKFNRQGGLVTITCEKKGDKGVVVIEDTGVGIAASDLPRIFERLYRADKSRSNRIEGTGLGLAIVKHLVQAHCGEITASSEFGRGSSFTFTLPLQTTDEQTSERIEAELSAV